jgi:hypothetical protein
LLAVADFDVADALAAVLLVADGRARACRPRRLRPSRAPADALAAAVARTWRTP